MLFQDQVGSSHQERDRAPVRGYAAKERGKRARREEAKEKQRRKKETTARWWRKVSHLVSVPQNHVGIGFVSESALLDWT